MSAPIILEEVQMGILSWIGDTVVAAWDNAKNTARKVENLADETIKNPRKVIDKAKQVVATKVSNAYNATVEGVETAGEWVADTAVATGEAVAEGARTAYNATVEGAQAAGVAIAEGAESASNATVEGVEAAGEWIADTAVTTGEAVAEGARTAYNATVEGAQAAGAAIVEGAESAYNATVEGVEAAGEWVEDRVEEGTEAAAVAGATLVKGGIHMAKKGKELLQEGAEFVANAPKNAEKWADATLAKHNAQQNNTSGNQSPVASADTKTPQTQAQAQPKETAVASADTKTPQTQAQEQPKETAVASADTKTPQTQAQEQPKETAVASADTKTPQTQAQEQPKETAVASADTKTPQTQEGTLASADKPKPQTVAETESNQDQSQKITEAYAKSRIVTNYNDSDHEYAQSRLTNHSKELNLTTNAKGRVTHKKTKVSQKQLDSCLGILKDMEEKGLLPKGMNGQSNAKIYMHRLVLANQMGGEHQTAARQAIKSLLGEKPDHELIAKGVHATKGQTIDKKNAKYIASAGTQHSRITGDDGKEVDTETYVAKLREAQPQKGAIASTKTETKVSAPTTPTASAENKGTTPTTPMSSTKNTPQVEAPLLPEQKKDNLGTTSKTSEEMTISAPQTPRDKHIFDTEQPEIQNYSEKFANNGPLTLSYAMLQASHTK